MRMRTLTAAVCFCATMGVATAQDRRPYTNPIAIDVNGPHIMLHVATPRQWRGVAIELNDWWSYTIPLAMQRTSVCVNADAFTVKRSVRGGRDYDGIYFDPATMKVGSARVFGADGRPIPLQSVTEGFVAPLTHEQAAACLRR